MLLQLLAGVGAAATLVVAPVPRGYWRQPGHTCSSEMPSAAGAADQCAMAAAGNVDKLAVCCNKAADCGGFETEGGLGELKGPLCSLSSARDRGQCSDIVCASDQLCKGKGTGSLCGCACTKTAAAAHEEPGSRAGQTCCGTGAAVNSSSARDLYIKTSVPQRGGAQPTRAQLAWQQHEVGAFVSWTIEEHCGPLGNGAHDFPACWKNTPGSCQAVQGSNSGLKECADCPRPSAFRIGPKGFTDGWAQSMRDLGATYAVMVLKQHCGWAMWPTNVSLPSGERYGYSVAYSPTPDRDIAREFATSCRKFNITPGFYM
jgi:hypothetical protein